MTMPSVDSLHIRVIGVGGAGGNAVDRMIQAGVSEVQFVAANTDAQALAHSEAQVRVQLGPRSARGLGVGGDPEWGARAAEESQEAIRGALRGADVVFIAAGMGGGTGTGAAPVVARIARDLGALTIAAVTCPFSFEGSQRRKTAEQGIEALSRCVNSLIVVPNDRLLPLVGRDMTFDVALRIADDVLRQGIQGISELITRPGLVNLDFASIRTALEEAGGTLMAIGRGEGQGKALAAAAAALNSPLLNFQLITEAKTIMVNITGGSDLTLHEIGEAAQLISEAAHPSANILFGAIVDHEMLGEARVILVAGGLELCKQEMELTFGKSGSTSAACTPAIPVEWPASLPARLDSGGLEVNSGETGVQKLNMHLSAPMLHSRDVSDTTSPDGSSHQIVADSDTGRNSGGPRASAVASQPAHPESQAEERVGTVETPVRAGSAMWRPPWTFAAQKSARWANATPVVMDHGRREEQPAQKGSDADQGDPTTDSIVLRFLPNLDVPAFLRR